MLTFDGTTWTMPRAPQRADADNLLADVSCGDVDALQGRGYTIDDTDDSVQTLVLSPQHVRLDARHERRPAQREQPAARRLVPHRDHVRRRRRVGPGPGSLDEQSLIETLSAGTWTLATSPDRAGYDNHLWAVSCSNAANCVAAGQSQNDDLARPLIQTLAGRDVGA